MMIPDFPHDIRIRMAQLNFFLLRPDIAKSLPSQRLISKRWKSLVKTIKMLLEITKIEKD